MTPQSSFLENWTTGFERLLSGESTAFACVLAAFALCAVVELIIPAQPGQRWLGKARNLSYLAIYVSFGLAALSLWYTVMATGSRSSRDTLPIESLFLVPVYLFVGDFAYYWYHRAEHRFRPLWAIHELHHADAELNVTTSYRTFWLEAPVQSILLGTPVLWLIGRPGATFAVVSMAISRSVLLFAHCNFRLSLGPFTPIICGPQWHRIHHSRLAKHQDRNFAQIFPVIDWIFGTYYAPADTEYPPTGTEGLRSDESLWRAQMRPLAIWRQEAADWLNRRRSRGVEGS